MVLYIHMIFSTKNSIKSLIFQFFGKFRTQTSFYSLNLSLFVKTVCYLSFFKQLNLFNVYIYNFDLFCFFYFYFLKTQAKLGQLDLTRDRFCSLKLNLVLKVATLLYLKKKSIAVKINWWLKFKKKTQFVKLRHYSFINYVSLKQKKPYKVLLGNFCYLKSICFFFN